MIGGKTISCRFCCFDLFDEYEATIEFKNVFVCDQKLSQFWADGDNKIRCCHCDAVIGKRLTNIPEFVVIWQVKAVTEDKDNDSTDYEVISNIIQRRFAAIFLERFAQVCLRK